MKIAKIQSNFKIISKKEGLTLKSFQYLTKIPSLFFHSFREFTATIVLPI